MNKIYDSKFMKNAFEQAEEALEKAEVPVGCVIVFDDSVIGYGRNRTNETRNATRHAEFEAVDKVWENRGKTFKFNQCDLYVTVEPCIMCSAALRYLEFRNIFYGCSNEKFGGCGSVLDVISNPTIELYPIIPSFSGFMKEEAIILLRKFYIRENDHAPRPKKKSNRVLNVNFD